MNAGGKTLVRKSKETVPLKVGIWIPPRTGEVLIGKGDGVWGETVTICVLYKQFLELHNSVYFHFLCCYNETVKYFKHNRR